MKVIERDGDNGLVESEGIRRQVSLKLLDNVRLNDWVIVHAGFAIAKLNQQEARKTRRLFRQMALRPPPEAGVEKG